MYTRLPMCEEKISIRLRIEYRTVECYCSKMREAEKKNLTPTSRVADTKERREATVIYRLADKELLHSVTAHCQLIPKLTTNI